MTQAAVTGLSFRLRANEKIWIDWNEFYQSNPYLTSANRMGDIVYSTKGYTGGDAYIYVQRADGGWQKQMMKADGKVDLGYFKGYVLSGFKYFRLSVREKGQRGMKRRLINTAIYFL